MAVRAETVSSEIVPAHVLGSLRGMHPNSPTTFWEAVSPTEQATERFIAQEEGFVEQGGRLFQQHAQTVSKIIVESSIFQEDGEKLLTRVSRECNLNETSVGILLFWIRREDELRKIAQNVYKENARNGIDQTQEQNWQEAIRRRAQRYISRK